MKKKKKGKMKNKNKASEKEAGGDAKHVFIFIWPDTCSLTHSSNDVIGTPFG